MGRERADFLRVAAFNSEFQSDKNAVYSHNRRFFLVPLPPSASLTSLELVELHSHAGKKRIFFFFFNVASVSESPSQMFICAQQRQILIKKKKKKSSSLSVLRNGVAQVKLWRVSRQHVSHQLLRRHTCGSRHYGCNCHRRK